MQAAWPLTRASDRHMRGTRTAMCGQRVEWCNGWVGAMSQVQVVQHKSHAEQALQTVVDLLEATDDETLQIDGSVMPGFEEWRLKGVKRASFVEMAPTDRRDAAVGPALWNTN